MGTRHMAGSVSGSAGPARAISDAMLSCHVVAGCTFGSTGERRFVPAWEPRCMPYCHPIPILPRYDFIVSSPHQPPPPSAGHGSLPPRPNAVGMPPPQGSTAASSLAQRFQQYGYWHAKFQFQAVKHYNKETAWYFQSEHAVPCWLRVHALRVAPSVYRQPPPTCVNRRKWFWHPVSNLCSVQEIKLSLQLQIPTHGMSYY